jgi:hypothetical protein
VDKACNGLITGFEEALQVAYQGQPGETVGP